MRWSTSSCTTASPLTATAANDAPASPACNRSRPPSSLRQGESLHAAWWGELGPAPAVADEQHPVGDRDAAGARDAEVRGPEQAPVAIVEGADRTVAARQIHDAVCV